MKHKDAKPTSQPDKSSRRWKKYGVHRLSFLERHCPPAFERKECLVPPPDGYKVPIKWPKSRDECWYRNVPYDWINKQKSNQNWLRKEGDKFRFPGGGTMFPNGVSAYVDLMRDLIPEMHDGTIRTAIDTGCGVASWGGDLLDRGILTVSLAPRDNHEAQVQFALERGIPAILGVISTQRLPFPSSSFDMAHCSRCLIPWTEFGGIYLLEVNRILRPGGFWILSGPPVNYENRWRGWNTTIEEQKSDYEKLQDLLTSMCFTLYNKKDDIAVWQKSKDNRCYAKLAVPDAYPPKCDDGTEPDSAWYTPLRPCIVVPNPKLNKLALKSVPKWPERLHVAPERVGDIHGGSASGFKHDNSKWKVRAKHYKKLVPAIGTDKIRNLMDMNTLYGGFAAALISDPLWVMNVVSSYAPNTLAVVYDRGLIGTYHDWCEAFSTYPRTYDLLHFDGLFTAESHRCEMKYVLLEMDRILRPNGYAIIRESSYYVDAVAAIAKGMKWGCRKEDTEYGVEKEKLLVCQKKLWYSSKQTSR
ncbi:S-adenosyl-L-methionine-dependent methyltransferases superfamily protein [Actinidia rufa]|uniref:Methyltransferase n=1 Tax=Actinidia rufa TaxID=165716 RepID=A0A7J0GZX4_9ERIC|nr:S-adenosyl-L-methionine-dependent methyltransferases superfamily protein [Actinidia rufa]